MVGNKICVSPADRRKNLNEKIEKLSQNLDSEEISYITKIVDFLDNKGLVYSANGKEGTKKTLKQLKAYSSGKKELISLRTILNKEELDIQDIETNFTSDRAKDFEHLCFYFMNAKKQDKMYENILIFMTKADKYYRETHPLNLIRGKGALVAEGMFGPIDRD